MGSEMCIRDRDYSEKSLVAVSHFYCDISNQELNDFGTKVVNWSQNMGQEFIYEW